MDLNRFIFPAPSASYTPFTLGQLLWIPRTRFFSMKTLIKMDSFENYYASGSKYSHRAGMGGPGKKEYTHIPCHFQTYGDDCKDIIVFFHGNAEDIGNAATFTRKLAVDLKTNVLSVEYPGYGVYEGETSAKAINEDAEIIFDFLTAEVGINPKNIIVFGRSIGSGPATHLAANRKPGALILMSPYTSIKAVVKDIAGGLLSVLFAERFSNIEEIQKAECPCFFLHGRKDRVIPWEHSKALYEKCKASAAISISESMTHNTFKMTSDVIAPVGKFLKQHGLTQERGCFDFPEYVMRIPMKKFRSKSRDMTAKFVDGIVSDS